MSKYVGRPCLFCRSCLHSRLTPSKENNVQRANKSRAVSSSSALLHSASGSCRKLCVECHHTLYTSQGRASCHGTTALSMMRFCKYLNGAQTLIRLKMGAKQGKPKRKCVNKARPWPQVIQSTHRFKAISNDGGTRGLQLGGCSRNGFVLRMLGWWKQTQAATMVVIVMQLSSRGTGPLLLLTPPPPTH